MSRAPLPDPGAIEAVLFDLDDTLVDARGSWRAAFAGTIADLHARTPALRRLGGPAAIYDRLFRRYGEEAHAAGGGGEWEARFTREAFERLLDGRVAEPGGTADGLAGRLHAAYAAASLRLLALHDHALETLDLLGARYPLGLVSNGPAGLQRPKLERFGLEGRFGAIAISGEAGVRKPDPAIFALALGPLGASPERAVHVGDSPAHDVAGARAAGVAAVWVNRGDWPDAPLRGPSAPPHAEVRGLREARLAILGR